MPPQFAIDKTIVLDNARYHYRDWGGAGRLIVLLHDVGSSAQVWDLVAPLLTGLGHVIAFDQRGHGQSAKPPEGYTFDHAAADLHHLTAAVGSTGAPFIVGHGWGARVALHTTATTPLAPALLVLLDGAIIDMRGLPPAEVTSRYDLPSARGEFEMAFRERIIQQAPQGVITPAVEAAIMARYYINADDQVYARLTPQARQAILDAISQQALPPLYQQLRTPLLILLTRSPDGSTRYKQLAAGLRHIDNHLDDVQAHWLEPTQLELPLQRPHAIADALKRYARERFI